MHRPSRSLPILPLLALLGYGAAARAQMPPAGKGPVVIDINNPRRDLYKVAVPALVGDPETARLVTDVVSTDLALSGWFKVLDPKSFLANPAKEGIGIVVEDWRNVGAEGISKGRATVAGGEAVLDFRLFELGRGDRPVLEKSYRCPVGKVRDWAHTWADEVVRYFTGEGSFFRTKIAFSAPTGSGRKDLFVMDFDGNDVRQLTNNGSFNLLPAWSPSGDRIAFTSFVRGNPDLYLIPAAGGRPKRISDRRGVNTGAAFSPDGGKIAATLSTEGNPDVHLLAADGAILSRLTNSPFIDSSPSFSPDGGTIAFVSNRQGSPQIWTMSATGGNQARLTRAGNYNQEPAFCPACPTPTIAFTGRDEKGRFDIFTMDVRSGQMVRISENQGSFEHPSWAPNGRAIAAASRGGIWIFSADGKHARQVYKGPASTPAWGPQPARK